MMSFRWSRRHRPGSGGGGAEDGLCYPVATFRLGPRIGPR